LSYSQGYSASADSFLDKSFQLAVCLVMDFLGMATYLIPIAGEAGDIIFAPLEGWWIWTMMNSRRGDAMTFAVMGIIEEGLPLVTDWIPMCTISWWVKYNT
jgi:hypothetical protein